MNKVYLAGALTCYYKENKFEKATKWRKMAEKYFEENTDNFVCINPIYYITDNSNHHATGYEIMRFDLRKVKESKVILVNLESLHKSIETSDEIMYAWLNDIPIIGFLEDESLIDTLHSWKICQIDRIEIGKGSQERAMEYIKNYYE